MFNFVKKTREKVIHAEKWLYRNSSLHEAYSCKTNIFIEFHHYMKKE